MERVTGFGGFFFRASDPPALSRWYAERLGVLPPPQSMDDAPWEQEAGITVFGPSGPAADDLGLLGPGGFGLNFRVADLEAMVEQLRSAGETVEVDPTDYPYGRFASLRDPEGNPIQLWEPA